MAASLCNHSCACIQNIKLIMARINSKNKGSRFERTICKWFQDWTGYEFNRVPASGGLRWKKTDNITSDITCTDPKHSKRFKLSVECKSYNDLKFEHILLGNKGCKILSFWEQASNDAIRGNKIPVLIMKYSSGIFASAVYRGKELHGDRDLPGYSQRRDLRHWRD